MITDSQHSTMHSCPMCEYGLTKLSNYDRKAAVLFAPTFQKLLENGFLMTSTSNCTSIELNPHDIKHSTLKTKLVEYLFQPISTSMLLDKSDP